MKGMGFSFSDKDFDMPLIKVGMVFSEIKNSGPINVVRALLNSFYSSGKNYECEVVVFCLTSSCDLAIVEEFRAIGVRVVSVSERVCLKTIVSLAKKVTSYKIDLLHSHGITSDIIVSILPNRVKRLCTIHNRLLEDYIPLFGRSKAFVAFAIHWWACKRFDILVACSSSVSQALKRVGLNGDNVITNGVNTGYYKPLSDTARREKRIAYGIPIESVVYFYSGSFCKRKSVDSLIRRLVLSKSDLLILAGTGELINECKALVSGDARYRFVGHLKSCLDYYQIADFCVSASRSEGLPLSLLEAYCCGAKLLISDIPSHKEIFELVRGNDVQLFRLSQDGYIDVAKINSQSAKAREIENLSSDKMAEQYKLLYLRLWSMRNQGTKA